MSYIRQSVCSIREAAGMWSLSVEALAAACIRVYARGVALVGQDGV